MTTSTAHSARRKYRLHPRLSIDVPLRIALCLLVLAGLLAGDLGQVDAAELAPFSGRWIDVNLSTLTATAYNGSKAVYSAPVTAGKKGYATPTGTYRIYSQVRVTDMRSFPGDREQYYVKNVEYVQYFRSGGYAIHSNYWAPSSVFGRRLTSHGCVSMRRNHAAYFWSFADVGTPVYIHYGPPKVSVAKVVGKSQSAARSQLLSGGFKVAVTQRVTASSSPGAVVEQRPRGGTSATKGSTVTLVVATEPKLTSTAWSMGTPYPPVLPYGDPSATSTWTPSVVGLGASLAVSRVEQAGLRVKRLTLMDESIAPARLRSALKAAKVGTVVAVSAPAGTERPRGSELLIVMKGR